MTRKSAGTPKSTPGPWKWQEKLSYSSDIGGIYAGDKRVCWFGNDETYYPTEGEPPCSEDLALMLAAPALLEALRPIADAYPNDPGTSDLYDEQPVTITLGDVRRAWRAIAQAEGSKR